MHKSLLILLVTFCSFNRGTLSAQNIDTTNVQYFSVNSDTLELIRSIDGVQRFNPIFSGHQFYGNTGNIGLATRPLFFDIEQYRDFSINRNSYAPFEYSDSDIRYYHVVKPLTEVYFVLGPKKQTQQFQFGDVFHTQNVNKNLNVGFRLRRVVSTGVYAKQAINVTNATIFSSYRNNTNKYQILGNFVFNKNTSTENGGVDGGIMLLLTGRIDRTGIPVYLNNAKNLLSNGTFNFTQYFNVGSTYTLANDSNKTPVVLPASRIYIKSKMSLSEWYYKDVDSSNYYRYFNLDSLVSNDKFRNKCVSNEIGYELTENRYDKSKRNLTAYAGIGHAYLNNRQHENFNYYNNVWLHTGFAMLNKNKGSIYSPTKTFEMLAKYYLMGYNSNNVYSKATYYLGSSFALFNLSAAYNLSSPDYLANHLSTNHFKWKNNFDKQSMFTLSAEMQSNKLFNFKTSLSNINKYVFYNDSAFAEQASGAMNLLSVVFQKNFAFGRFHLNNTILFQKVISGDDKLRLPMLNDKHSMYLQGYLFHHNLLFQLGVDLFFNTAYYANAYMPSTTQFYLQNTEQTGNYVLADLFFNAQIKSVFITLKLEHANKGLLVGDYYMVPAFPMPDRLLKFGINWQFFN